MCLLVMKFTRFYLGMYAYTFTTYTYMHAIISVKRDHEFEGEWGGISGRAQRKEVGGKCCNYIISKTMQFTGPERMIGG